MSDPEGVSEIDVARRRSAPESNIFEGGLDQYDLHVLRKDPEGMEILHHQPIQLSLRFERAAREEDDPDPREAFPRGMRHQVIAGRVLDKARQRFVSGRPQGLYDGRVHGFQEGGLPALEPRASDFNQDVRHRPSFPDRS